jgi:hypothetical protein
MTDANAPAKPAGNAPQAEPDKLDKPVEEWKPEPRQWTWKDLFTAPMLAFKPKCMLVSAITLALIGAWWWLFDEHITTEQHGRLVGNLLEWIWYTVTLIIFSLGGTLVAVFLKADLLDDEFLTFGEALAQYKARLLPAVLVPLFLMGLSAGSYLALVYVPVLVSCIPHVGPFLYAVGYPLLYLFSLLVVLLGVAIWLSVFVFPSIIAIRKHGWFDNVVDTIEAVGTKPHVLAGSLLLSLLMMFVAFRIGIAGIDGLKRQYLAVPEGWEKPTRDNEARANDFYANDMLRHFDRHVVRHVDTLNLGDYAASFHPWPSRPLPSYAKDSDFIHYGTGIATGIWQILIQALIIGYIANLFVAGGMLTYLVVREDDYWDDEDLEDLDKLAKELEEEAKRDQPAPAPAAPAEAKPPEPVPPKPAVPPPAPTA